MTRHFNRRGQPKPKAKWHPIQRKSDWKTGEPDTHKFARLKTANVLKSWGFSYDFGQDDEGYRIPEIFPPLDRSKEYKIDIFATKLYPAYRPAGLSFNLVKLIEIDGDYHRSSKINIGKTKIKHAQILEALNIRLYHFDPYDILGMDDLWIAEKLGLNVVANSNTTRTIISDIIS
ncbi:MAG TPA: hypothetical protein VL854_06005 [Nitrososphaeraceae archaeon]|nr:hypothetical protein [Nitrososphaeraceae archaeon]